jgi:hypothetical protein
VSLEGRASSAPKEGGQLSSLGLPSQPSRRITRSATVKEADVIEQLSDTQQENTYISPNSLKRKPPEIVSSPCPKRSHAKPTQDAFLPSSSNAKKRAAPAIAACLKRTRRSAPSPPDFLVLKSPKYRQTLLDELRTNGSHRPSTEEDFDSVNRTRQVRSDAPPPFFYIDCLDNLRRFLQATNSARRGEQNGRILQFSDPCDVNLEIHQEAVLRSEKAQSMSGAHLRLQQLIFHSVYEKVARFTTFPNAVPI